MYLNSTSAVRSCKCIDETYISKSNLTYFSLGNSFVKQIYNYHLIPNSNTAYIYLWNMDKNTWRQSYKNFALK